MALPAIAVAQDQPEVVPEIQPEIPPQAVAPTATSFTPAEGEVVPSDPPPIASAVSNAIGAAFLTDDERRASRVYHGVWTEADLATPALRAQAALALGNWHDASLDEHSASVEDRAEARVLRGEFAEAFELLTQTDSLRASRLRGEALEALGRSEEAIAAIKPALDQLSDPDLPAEALLEVVRTWRVHTRLKGTMGEALDEYKAINALLQEARNHDKLAWPIRLAEAQLLVDKDNRAQGGEAALEALTLNPRAAQAWMLVGELAVDGFDVDQVESVAKRLELNAGGSTVSSAAMLARARLRLADAEGAELALAPARERYPKAVRLLALSAAAAALAYDEPAKQRWLARLAEVAPGSIEGVLAVGSALAEARQYDLAPPYLLQASTRSPYRPEPLIELGMMSLQAGRDMESIDALTKALKLDPFHARADNTLKLAQILAGYDRVESEHFIVRSTGPMDGLLAGEMLPLLETMHARVAGSAEGGIDHQPRVKTVIDLMPDDRAFSVRIAGVTQIHTMAASTGPCIAMSSPREGGGRRVGTYDWLRVVRHEYVHTVTLDRTSNRIPHWFTEAAAVFLEDAPRDLRTSEMLNEALENDALFGMDEINIKFIRPKKPIERALAYAQGHWMYEYMVRRWGSKAPLDLMDRYAKGERQNEAFAAVLGVSQDEFFSDFQSWAREQAIAWGLGQRPGEPTLRELLKAEMTPEMKSPPPISQAMIDRWLAAHPEHPEVLRSAVQLALKSNGGEPTEAMVPLLERLAAARPVDDLPHRMLSKLHLASGAPQRAIAHLEYLDIREQYTAVYAVELARQYASLRDWPKAMEKARRATIVAPFAPANRELLAAIAINAGDLALAERQLEALTIIEPDRQQHRARLESIRQKRPSR
jgi:cellulose synthase operon protein C